MIPHLRDNGLGHLRTVIVEPQHPSLEPIPRHILRPTEARVLIEQWRREYNQVRPYSSLGYQPPAPEAIMVRRLT